MSATVAQQAIAEMEEFRLKMRAIGQSSPAVEKFIDHLNALISVSGDPRRAIDALFALLAEERPKDPAVAEVIGARS
ncbi:hypothetical protein [Streptomyces sp. NPDC047079]|uniref:hypothetical protein n=1 Tax=Streptomyces sp. NPDC047079 TaxID=3154607 RepID=UPI0033DE5E05